MDSTTATPHSASAVAATAAAARLSEKPLTGRWLTLNTLSHSERYRSSDNAGGYHYFENGQQRSLLAGAIKIDADARYKIGFSASSGRFFSWAYADYAGAGFGTRAKNTAVVVLSYTPADKAERAASIKADPTGVAQIRGLPSNGWQFYMRELYFSATPVKAVTFEFGSFGFERGLASEITTFDEDGYLTGERIRIQNPKHLFFDQIGYTNAYIGDFSQPNLFERGGNFEKSNYHQVFAHKQINRRVGFSADYTEQVGSSTLRETTVVGVKELRVIDSVRGEVYERPNTVNLQGLNVAGSPGGALVFEKKVSRLSGDFGYAYIDKGYSALSGHRFFHAVGFGLNGDTYSIGQRDLPALHIESYGRGERIRLLHACDRA